MLSAAASRRKQAMVRSVSNPRSRLALVVPLLSVLVATPAEAAPPLERSNVAIPPGREQAARELLEPVLVERSDALSLRGPSIDRDRIEWWLLRGEQARARLSLLPRTAGEPEDPRSMSFAMQIAWEDDVEPEPAERALLEAAIASVQERDQGGFYVLLPETLLAPSEPPPQEPESRPISSDPERTRGEWTRKLAVLGVLIGFAIAFTLRRSSPS